MNVIYVVLALIIIIAISFGVYYLALWLMRKRSANIVDSTSIHDNIRKVQVVDVRENAEFNVKHILGARNIPMSEFSTRYHEIRKDIPVYLYDESYNYASRAANRLRKEGYDKVYILKGGISQWFGKTKSNL